MTEPAVVNITKPVKLKTIKEVNGLWYAELDIEKDDYIQPDCYVEFDDELYIVKRINKIKSEGKTFYRVNLEHYMVELVDLTVANFDYENKTPTYLLTQFLSGTDWGVGTVNLATPMDLKSDKRITILKALNLLAEECKGELDFLKGRIVDLKSQIGTVTELHLRYDKNCDYIEKQENTSQLCTRLYCYGRDDLTIESVNEGKVYLDSEYINNYKYRKEKVIYTNIENVNDLKTYAEAYLAIYEIPFLTYKVNLADLAKFKIWQHEIINLGDTLRIYDDELNLNVKVRVKKIKKDYVSENIYLEFATYLYLPKFDTITATFASLSETLSNLVFHNDRRALDIRDAYIGDTIDFKDDSVPVDAIANLPIVPVIYLGNPTVGIYQGPVIWMHEPCTAVEIMAYLKWIPLVGDVTITLNKSGLPVGQVTIPQGEYVAPGEGEVGTGATLSVSFSLGRFDKLNIDVDAIEKSDGVGNGIIVELRCVR